MHCLQSQLAEKTSLLSKNFAYSSFPSSNLIRSKESETLKGKQQLVLRRSRTFSCSLPCPESRFPLGQGWLPGAGSGAVCGCAQAALWLALCCSPAGPGTELLLVPPAHLLQVLSGLGPSLAGLACNETLVFLSWLNCIFLQLWGLGLSSCRVQGRWSRKVLLLLCLSIFWVGGGLPRSWFRLDL